jgi:hypothetical protein
MMKRYFNVAVLAAVIISSGSLRAEDSPAFDYTKIYSLCLDANVKPALSLVESNSTKTLSAKDTKFKAEIENRFMFAEDKSSYLEDKKSAISNLHILFHYYWRKSLLDTNKNYDKEFADTLRSFFSAEYGLPKSNITDDSLDVHFKKYVDSKGLHSVGGISKVGRLYDLLIWRTQKDTTYTIQLHKEKISARVVLMDSFITLGWEDYATLGKHYPGGWSTKDALFCVKKAYKLDSEEFLISYLGHEGRHFGDLNAYPKMKSPDLEYRAKLTELSLARKTLYELIGDFIDNANYDSQNGHSIADYCVIRDLSKRLFHVEFEKDINKWNKISVARINKSAYKILQANTKLLNSKDPNIQKSIKN